MHAHTHIHATYKKISYKYTFTNTYTHIPMYIHAHTNTYTHTIHTLPTHFVHTQRPKWQRVSCVCVHQQDLSIQNQVIASWEGFGDVVLEMGNLQQNIAKLRGTALL